MQHTALPHNYYSTNKKKKIEKQEYFIKSNITKVFQIGSSDLKLERKDQRRIGRKKIYE